MSNELMPFEAESEIGVLGSMLLSESKNIQDTLSGKLSEDHFWIRSHKIMWKMIAQMLHENAPVDATTLTVRLREAGTLAEVGGISYVTKIAVSQATSSHIDYFADRLIEKKKLRDLIASSSAIIAKAKSNQSSAELISELESKIDEMTKDGEMAFQNQLTGASQDLGKSIELRRQGKAVLGLQTGIRAFDDSFFGLKPHQYYVVAGKPSAGKTAFADQIVVNLLKKGEPVLYIGLESDRERILGKMAAKYAQVNFFNYSMMKFSDGDYTKLDMARLALSKMPLFLVTPPDLKGHQIRTLMRKAARRDKCKVVVLDYIQHISTEKDEDERIAIANASLQIQRGCIETGMAALVLSQFNRMGAESDRPKMSQLKGSGQLEQDADNIVLLWAEKEKHLLDIGELLPVVMTIEKNKDGPNGIDQKLLFDGPMMTFRDRIKDHVSQPERFY